MRRVAIEAPAAVPPRVVHRVVYCLLLSAPFLIVALQLPFYLKQWQDEGAEFKHHLVGFLLIIQGAKYWSIAALVMLPWMLIVLALYRWLTSTERALLFGSCTVVILGFVALAILSGSVYRSARTSLYNSINLPQINADASTLLNKLSPGMPPTEAVYFDEMNPLFKKLPASITSLKTRGFVLHASYLVLHLDGGGPASHEGIAYFANPSDPLIADASKKCISWSALPSTPGWYRFTAYDFRVIGYTMTTPNKTIAKLLSQ
jgi:hypothetical protein